MLAILLCFLLFWIIYLVLNLSHHYLVFLIMIVSHHNMPIISDYLHWHLSVLLKSPTSLMGFKHYKSVSYWEPHNLHSWNSIKPSENLINVVTIDLRCCLNNCTLWRRWWRYWGLSSLWSIFGFNTFGESNETSGTLAIPWVSIQGLPKCKANAVPSSLSDFYL
jgi:hypothetical protein